MKKYELLTIIKSNMDTEEVGKIVEKLEETMKSLNGNVLSNNMMGRKKLAYEIKKFRDAFFVSFDVELEESTVAELKRQLKLNDSILRFMFLTSDKVTA